ncbi:MAG: F0F1 ATP synthase subunit A [Chlorobi bacterium]|nr:F0F1 ATP synthase subunit A [Chlorobiota bacterium]
MNRKKTRISIIASILFLLLFFLLPAFSQPLSEGNPGDSKHQTVKEKFDPESFIFGHVLDEYEWHIFTYKNFLCTIPLPVILYSKDQGLQVFLSSKLHHGHKSYHGFSIAEEGPYKDKIIETHPDGTISRPVDLSITKVVVAILFSVFLLLIVFLSIAKRYRENPKSAPHGFQNVLEPVILFVRDEVAVPAIGKDKYEKYMPFLLTVFFFILLNNLLGLIPIPPAGANVTGNIAVPMIMALFVLVIVLVSATGYYWKEIFNAPGVPWWLKLPIPLLPLIEFMGLFIRPFVLMIRLFANIIAGHIVALGFFALIFIFGEMKAVAGYGVSVLTIFFTVFLTLLEILVAFIQAYVFTLLSALYFGMAREEGHH